MARDLPHEEPQHEDNLLVEAVTLLVQRQRETEAWVAEQIDQAEQRAGSVERQYADLEQRLAALEEQLERALREVEVGRGDRAVGQRLARLREQVADLRGGPVEGRQLRPVATTAAPPAAAPVAPATVASPTAPKKIAAADLWTVFGATARERFGLAAMFLGAVALLYAVLSQLRF